MGGIYRVGIGVPKPGVSVPGGSELTIDTKFAAKKLLRDAGRNAATLQAGAPNTVTTRNVTYSLDALNRKSVTDSGVVTTYGTPSGLNQYPTVGGLPLTYDANFNLQSYNG